MGRKRNNKKKAKRSLFKWEMYLPPSPQGGNKSPPWRLRVEQERTDAEIGRRKKREDAKREEKRSNFSPRHSCILFFYYFHSSSFHSLFMHSVISLHHNRTTHTTRTWPHTNIPRTTHNTHNAHHALRRSTLNLRHAHCVHHTHINLRVQYNQQWLSQIPPCVSLLILLV